MRTRAPARRAQRQAKSLEILAFPAMGRIGFESRIPESNQIRIQDLGFEPDSNPGSRIRTRASAGKAKKHAITLGILTFLAMGHGQPWLARASHEQPWPPGGRESMQNHWESLLFWPCAESGSNPGSSCWRSWNTRRRNSLGSLGLII